MSTKHSHEKSREIQKMGSGGTFSSHTSNKWFFPSASVNTNREILLTSVSVQASGLGGEGGGWW